MVTLEQLAGIWGAVESALVPFWRGPFVGGTVWLHWESLASSMGSEGETNADSRQAAAGPLRKHFHSTASTESCRNKGHHQTVFANFFYTKFFLSNSNLQLTFLKPSSGPQLSNASANAFGSLCLKEQILSNKGHPKHAGNHCKAKGADRFFCRASNRLLFMQAQHQAYDSAAPLHFAFQDPQHYCFGTEWDHLPFMLHLKRWLILENRIFVTLFSKR